MKICMREGDHEEVYVFSSMGGLITIFKEAEEEEMEKNQMCPEVEVKESLKSARTVK